MSIFKEHKKARASIALGLAATTITLLGAAGALPASAASADVSFGSQTYQTWEGLGASEAFGQA